MNGRKLCPRIILMTDGKPTDENGRETPQVRILNMSMFFPHLARLVRRQSPDRESLRSCRQQIELGANHPFS